MSREITYESIAEHYRKIIKRDEAELDDVTKLMTTADDVATVVMLDQNLVWNRLILKALEQAL